MRRPHRRSLTALAATAGMVAAIAVTPAVAHHPDGEDGSHERYEGFNPELERDWDVASNPGSNAPRTFAPCVRGMAADFFPCDGVDLLSHVSHAELGTEVVNDIWGWTDLETRRDYALVGASNGTVFVNISDPKRPVVLGRLPSASNEGNQFWRDIKVFADHAYIVSEHTDHGVQVFDLARLRDWDGAYTTYDADAHYLGHGSAHNIAINEDTGFAYSLGASRNPDSPPCDGLRIIDINEPKEPTYAGCFQDHGYVHDTQCVVYEGPDSRYHGHEICFNSIGIDYTTDPAFNFVSIVDVTDKQNPVSLALESYAGSGYSHQGWLTPDQRYFLHGDEGDEELTGDGTTTRVWDVSDLENPHVIQVFENETASIDHNIYTQGRYAYASNYTSGLRVYDTRDLPGEGLSEVAYFDIYPENDDATFDGGAWSSYPYFRQKGVVAVSSIDRGLFILQPRVARAGN